MATKNTLSRPQARVLEDLILEHKEEIESGKWTQKSFADFVVGKLRRPVTDKNVLSASRVVGVGFCNNRSGNRSGNRSNRTVKELNAAIVLLASEIERISGELGIVVQPEVHDLASERYKGRIGLLQENGKGT